MKRLLLASLLVCSSAHAFDTWNKPGTDFLCHGGHPRCTQGTAYRYNQFPNVPIGDFAGYSDVLPNGPELAQYQTFLSELVSFRPKTNAVAIWGDAMARVDDAMTWGGFVSARSWYPKEKFPNGADSELTGLEIDVLNDGKPGIAPNYSKIALEIVGFGHQNTDAIQVINQSATSGQFTNGITFGPTALAGDGAYLGATSNKPMARGIDFQGVKFSDAAMMLSQGSAIAFANKRGVRSEIRTDDDNRLMVRAGENGLRVIRADGNKDLMSVTPTGDVVTPYGSFAKLRSDVDALQSVGQMPAAHRLLLPLALVASMIVNVVSIFMMLGMRRRQLVTG